MSHTFQGLGTVIYAAPDLERAKQWYATVFEQQPHFDQPFYVGFNIAGYELGLDPNGSATGSGRGGAVAYWRVDHLQRALDRFAANGATIVSPLADVGDGIQVAIVADPFDNLIGLIHNPHFKLPAS